MEDFTEDCEKKSEKKFEKEANNLRRVRTERGLSQEEVAQAIGVSRPTYIKIEAGKKELTVSQVEEIWGYF